VAGLLSGERMTIKPAGWDHTHERQNENGRQAADATPSAEQLAAIRNVDVAPEGNAPTWVKIN
jgi:hypothetical protein